MRHLPADRHVGDGHMRFPEELSRVSLEVQQPPGMSRVSPMHSHYKLRSE
jgi:hypothetical protein